MMFPCPGWTSPQAYKTERGASTTAVSVVIPVYNERAYIEEVLLRVQAVQLDKEVLVIDDGSADGTRELLREFEKVQAEGRTEAPVQNGHALLPLDGIHFIFQDLEPR